MNNYITERELKGFIPELSKYLWTGENDFSKQKIQAEQSVISDLSNKGYKIRQLQPKIYLDTSGVEDTINGLRFVSTSTGAGSVILSGASTEDGTYETIITLTFVKAETRDYLITNPYKYYKINSEDYVSYIVETIYDRLFAYKWIELILMDSYKEEGDAYYTRMIYFKTEYENLINKLVINVDSDDDGEISEGETITTNSINVTR